MIRGCRQPAPGPDRACLHTTVRRFCARPCGCLDAVDALRVVREQGLLFVVVQLEAQDLLEGWLETEARTVAAEHEPLDPDRAQDPYGVLLRQGSMAIADFAVRRVEASGDVEEEVVVTPRQVDALVPEGARK